MPRDDLSIDFIGRRGKMVQNEAHDPAAVLEEWVNRVANLPAEIAFMQEEIEQKDRLMQECMTIITKCDSQIQKWIRQHGSHVPNPKEEFLNRQITENYDKAEVIQSEKVALANKTKAIMDKHTRWLDGHIKGMVDRNEFSVEEGFPSLLNANNDTTAASLVLPPSANPTPMTNPRHPNQHPPRPIPAHVHPTSAASSSVGPATPASAMHPGRNAREASQGAANKRQKLTGGVPLQTSLARQTSNAPGTPRGATPISGRAGSAGPRASQTATKKIISHGNKPSGVPRNKQQKKSTLNRVKGTRNKNSPSSTNDSDLSDAESGSVDDDEAHTPAGNRDGDEDMVDIDEEGGEGDDRVYCICQKVSFGDMVACDNDNCKFEWFHWNCVGLKSEPEGVWICPPCRKAGFTK